MMGKYLTPQTQANGSKAGLSNGDAKYSTSVGAADFGSGKFHCVIHDVDGNELDHFTATPNLAKNMKDVAPYCSKESIDAAVFAFTRCAALLSKHGVTPDHCIAVGTEALRCLERSIIRDELRPRKRKKKSEPNLLDLFQIAFSPYCFRVISEDEEADWVAKAFITSISSTTSQEIMALLANHSGYTIAYSGGLSTEMVTVQDHQVQCKRVLRYGTFASPIDASADTTLHQGHDAMLLRELAMKWPAGGQATLFVGGGRLREIGPLICAPGKEVTSATEALPRLTWLRKQDEAYFDVVAKKKHRPFMAQAASALSCLIEYVGAEHIIFVKTKMVSAIVAELLSKASPPPGAAIPSSPPPSLPSARAQSLHA